MAIKKTKATPKKKVIKKKNTEAKAVPAPNNGETSISVRKIDNGWVVNESWLTPRGQYKSKETFTKEKPVLNIK